jgi:hypothetical protein
MVRHQTISNDVNQDFIAILFKKPREGPAFAEML